MDVLASSFHVVLACAPRRPFACFAFDAVEKPSGYRGDDNGMTLSFSDSMRICLILEKTLS